MDRCRSVYILRLFFTLLTVLFFTANCFADSSYDRKLVVKEQARAEKAKEVLASLISAYEEEDAREFVRYVSEDRFRQDYLTFTDALYQDFRTYEIHHVEYWVNRVVSDNVKQFVYVNWEKRYETLDDSRQLFQKGFSLFVFDEVNGEYLLIELGGNDLFGASLAEWTDETPSIPGEEHNPGTSSPGEPELEPDLVVGPVTMIGSSEIEVTIQNIGDGASGPTQVKLTEGVTFSTDYMKNIPGLAPGGVHTFTQFFGGPPPYTITVDPNNTVFESDDDNNTKNFNADF